MEESCRDSVGSDGSSPSALREDQLAALIDASTANQRIKFDKQERANRLSLIIMKKAMTQYVKGGIPKHVNAKEFLAANAKGFL